jgi:hypothetical protein
MIERGGSSTSTRSGDLCANSPTPFPKNGLHIKRRSLVFIPATGRSMDSVLGHQFGRDADRSRRRRRAGAGVVDQCLQDNASGSRQVHAGLLEAVLKARGRVLITTFASNAARLETSAR